MENSTTLAPALTYGSLTNVPKPILAAGKQGVRQSFKQNRWLASQADRPSHAKVHGKQPEEQDTLVDMHTTKQIPKQQVYMLTLVSSSHTASASNHDKMA